MLDLKSKLLAAGLVTQEQVKKVDEEKEQARKARQERRQAAKEGPRPNNRPRPHHDRRTERPKKPAQPFENFEAKQRDKQLALLKTLSRNEQYDMIRRWVERNRFDKHTAQLPEKTERFFFQKMDGSITWLTLDAAVHTQVTDGKAAIIAHMSHHGLAHCVVPVDIAEDVAQVFPYWLRVLKDHPEAGKIQPESERQPVKHKKAPKTQEAQSVSEQTSESTVPVTQSLQVEQASSH